MIWLIAAFAVGVLSGAGAVLFRRRRGLKGRGQFPGKSQEARTQAAVQIRLAMGPSIVAVGGGTGLSSLLLGLKAYTKNLSAVVTVTDEGGSSGRLIRDWGVLPPGDIRNGLVALSENDSHLSSFLDFRFDRGDLKGHSLGNLMLLAAIEQTGDFKNGVQLMNRLLSVRGRVLPITTEVVTLAAKLEDGGIVRGELEVSQHGDKIEEIWLEPKDAEPERETIQAVEGADMIVLGPGSLFTSVIPNLLVPGFADAVRDGAAPVIYVANLMTQPGETSALSLMDHVRWIAKTLGRFPDGVVVNQAPIVPALRDRYEERGSVPLTLSEAEEEELVSLGCNVYRELLLQVKDGTVIRHHSARLAEVLMRALRHFRPLS